jgi:hypothetical protein
VITSLATVLVLAAENAGDPASLLLTYGPLGIFAVFSGVAARVAWRKFSDLLTAATARAEASEQKYQAIVDKLVEQVIPAVVRSTDATADLLAELGEMRRERR